MAEVRDLRAWRATERPLGRRPPGGDGSPRGKQARGQIPDAQGRRAGVWVPLTSVKVTGIHGTACASKEKGVFGQERGKWIGESGRRPPHPQDQWGTECGQEQRPLGRAKA